MKLILFLAGSALTWWGMHMADNNPAALFMGGAMVGTSLWRERKDR